MIVLLVAFGVVLLMVFTGLAVTGYEIGWGPFAGLFKGWESEVKAIEARYDAEAHQKEIVFYGASNFRLWKEMENDLAPYPVQNHGFGGCTDHDLRQYAGRILYPYNPKIVFFQTGSNDYVNLSGTDAEKVGKCMAYKREMFAAFHEHLPDAHFVVMSGLLLPGRAKFTEMTREINRQLRLLCEEYEYMTFVDAEDMTFDGVNYRTELFVDDQIHLNHDGQLLWSEKYIKPTLQKLLGES